MPTAGKLAGAILFAALSYYVSEIIRDVMPGGPRMTLFSLFNTGLGAIMGWRISGTRAGEGFVAAIGYGLTTIFAVTFWSLLIWSSYQMFLFSIRGRYGGPSDALVGMGDQMLDNAATIVTPTVVGWAVLGSVVCGLITEFVSHRWS